LGIAGFTPWWAIEAIDQMRTLLGGVVSRWPSGSVVTSDWPACQAGWSHDRCPTILTEGIMILEQSVNQAEVHHI
jgi:hypothetical protein